MLSGNNRSFGTKNRRRGRAFKRIEVLISGHVQGVGFRYTARQLSRSIDVVGTVQNLPDRRVKMVLEGESEAIERFIREVCESTHGSVTQVEKRDLPATGEFSSFEIIP